jgi:hypothetical protein
LGISDDMVVGPAFQAIPQIFGRLRLRTTVNGSGWVDHQRQLYEPGPAQSTAASGASVTQSAKLTVGTVADTKVLCGCVAW